MNSLMGIRSNGNMLAEVLMIHIKGDITDDGNIENNGVAIEGLIHLPADEVTIEASGRVNGHVIGRSVTVHGAVTGDVAARESVAVMAFVRCCSLARFGHDVDRYLGVWFLQCNKPV